MTGRPTSPSYLGTTDLLVDRRLAAGPRTPEGIPVSTHDEGMTVRRRYSATSTSTARPPTRPSSPADFRSRDHPLRVGRDLDAAGPDRRSRSMVTPTALVARGHHEELALHLRAALRKWADRRRDQRSCCRPRSTAGAGCNTAFPDRRTGARDTRGVHRRPTRWCRRTDTHLGGKWRARH